MRRVSCEVLVVGAGPAGLAAAVSASHAGARVGIIDDTAAPGGQIWRAGIHGHASRQASRWIGQLAGAGIALHSGTRVVAAPERGKLLAETAGGPVEFCGEQIILATGARELLLPFPGWTLPGVVGVGGLQALVKGGLPIAGKRVVVAGSGPLLLAAAAYLRTSGARVALIAEQTTWRRLAAFAPHLVSDPAKLVQAISLGRSLHRVPMRSDCWVVRAHGTDHLEAVTVRTASGNWTTPCEYLACGFGLVPNLDLPAALGCSMAGAPSLQPIKNESRFPAEPAAWAQQDHVHRYAGGAVWVDRWQQSSVRGVYCAGEATGIGGLEAALVEGKIAGFAAAGDWPAARALFAERARTHRFADALMRGFALRDELRALGEDETLICRCEDVPLGDVRQHTSWRAAKLQTRCGMGPCQGRICGAATSFLFGWAPDSTRPPIVPATLGTFARAADNGAMPEQDSLLDFA